MKPLLNTLFITQPNVRLCYSNQAVVVKVEDDVIQRVPLHNIEQIVTFNYTAASAQLMYECAVRNIALSFHSPQGKFLARVSGPTSGNVLVRRQQIIIAENDEQCLQFAQSFISSKISNQLTLLKNGIKNLTTSQKQAHLRKSSLKLAQNLSRLHQYTTLEQLRGFEGANAALYFSCFSQLILSKDPNLQFHTRTKRPPQDNVNVMLSFGYTLLKNDVMAALEACGLDPYIGYLHQVKPGKPALALDVMEELRPVYVDRFVLKCINKKIILSSHFEQQDEQLTFTAEGKKKFLQFWQKEKQIPLFHAAYNQSTPFGLIPYLQAAQLNKFLRGELTAYTPYTWR